MPKQIEPSNTTAAFDHNSTLVVALELSGKSWEAGAVVPGVARRPRRRLAPRDLAGLLRTIGLWKAEAEAAGRAVQRVVLSYEAGRDGFWIARYLLAQGIEVQVMHPASIPVPRRSRRAKTDRIDLDMLLRTLLAWLRGEPRVCSMVRIASEAEEELRRPGRERERLVRERLQLESRVESLLCLHGIVGFKPRLKKAFERLEALQTFAGSPLPPKTMAELRRLMVRHRLVSDPTARDRGRARRGREDRRAGPRRANDPAADPDRRPRCRDRDRSGPRDARLPFGTDLGGRDAVTDYGCKMPPFRVVPPSQFRDRRALASFVGLTGTPFQSGGMEREQGIGKNGNARVRHILMQLAWRWLRFQPQSPLSRWFVQRTSGAKGRIRKVMIVALARKLLVALWRYVETGELPADARTAAA